MECGSSLCSQGSHAAAASHPAAGARGSAGGTAIGPDARFSAPPTGSHSSRVGPLSARRDYSYLSASIGSSRDARMAGKMPKKMPTIAEKLMPRAKDHQGRKTGKPVK